MPLTERLFDLLLACYRHARKVPALFLRPVATEPTTLFRERALRALFMAVFVFVVPILILDLLGWSQTALPPLWNIIVLVLIGSGFGLLRQGHIETATRIVPLGMVLILLYPPVSYYSPATVVIGVLLTLCFQIIMRNRREIIIAVGANLALYVGLVFWGPQNSPLHPRDYFSARLPALFTVIMTHLLILGIIFLLRRSLEARGRMEVALERKRAAALYQFLSHASHDLRTPLTVMQLKMYLVGRLLPPSAAFDALQKTLWRLEARITAMLGMAERDAPPAAEPEASKETPAVSSPLHPLVRVGRALVNRISYSRATLPGEAFRERALRWLGFMGLVFFISVGVDEFLRQGGDKLPSSWVALPLALIVCLYGLLHRRQINWAARLVTGALVLIPIDPTAAYYSPGTVLFTMVFTLIFQLLLEGRGEMLVAVGLNLAIYAGLAVSGGSPAPLDEGDVFRYPALALFTMAVAQAILIGIAHLIRQSQRELDEIALRAERQRADVLRGFLSHASDDLQALLGEIPSQVEALQAAGTATSLSYLHELGHATTQLTGMVLSMHDMAALDAARALPPAQVPFVALVGSVVEEYRARAAAKGVRLDYRVEAGGATVIGQGSHLRRAVASLLDNAVTYTPAGSIEVALRRARGEVRVRVCDTGMGIAAADLPHIFEHFYRGDAARSHVTGLNGLGLAITQRIVELHGGRVEVESAEGVGSCFTVILPAARREIALVRLPHDRQRSVANKSAARR